MLLPKNLKTGSELTYTDFKTHPIWTFYDDDGDDVVPVEYPGWATEAIGGEGMFVACEYTLNDGTKLSGVVLINIYTNLPYRFEFRNNDSTLIGFPVKTVLENKGTRKQLAKFLGKSIAEVFPIHYATPFILENGILLEGKHD